MTSTTAKAAAEKTGVKCCNETFNE